jgi:hypothetical protein
VSAETMTPDAVFETPPAFGRTSKTRGKWPRFTDTLSASPGRWGRTPFSISPSTAVQMASNIRNGRLNTNRTGGVLDGEWEAVYGEVDGEWFVWARRLDGVTEESA